MKKVILRCIWLIAVIETDIRCANLITTIISDVTSLPNLLGDSDQLKICSTLTKVCIFKGPERLSKKANMTKFVTTEERLLTAIVEDIAELGSTVTPYAGLVGIVASTIKEAVDLVFGTAVKIAPVCFVPLHDSKTAIDNLFDKVNAKI